MFNPKDLLTLYFFVLQEQYFPCYNEQSYQPYNLQ